MSTSFFVSEKKRLALTMPASLAGFFTLSPFVWKARTGYEMLLRLVNPSPDASRKVARIHYATSADGLNFSVSDLACLIPGPSEEDKDGCEDPTLATVDDLWHVYYTGWNQKQKRSELLYASGPGATSLTKHGVAIPSRRPFENTKEATLARGGDNVWNLFFEYADDDASQIGLAKSESARGPWRVTNARIVQQRQGMWDDWHLSPGPIAQIGDRNYMFYNGGTRKPTWRIGWVAFDVCCETIIDRCEEPTIVPPPPKGDETDIAFAASLVQRDGELWLYYSSADKYLNRATVTWEA